MPTSVQARVRPRSWTWAKKLDGEGEWGDAMGGGHLVGGGVGDGFVSQTRDEGEDEAADEPNEEADASAQEGAAREAADDSVGSAQGEADQGGGEREKQQCAGAISRGLLLEILGSFFGVAGGRIGDDDEAVDGRQTFFGRMLFDVARDVGIDADVVAGVESDGVFAFGSEGFVDQVNRLVVDLDPAAGGIDGRSVGDFRELNGALEIEIVVEEWFDDGPGGEGGRAGSEHEDEPVLIEEAAAAARGGHAALAAHGGLALEEIVDVRAGGFFEADFDRLGFGDGWWGFDGLVHKVPYLLVAGCVEGAVAGAACLAFCASSSRRLSSAWNQASRSSGGTSHPFRSRCNVTSLSPMGNGTGMVRSVLGGSYLYI